MGGYVESLRNYQLFDPDGESTFVKIAPKFHHLLFSLPPSFPSLPPSLPPPRSDVRASPEPPCTLLWALFFLAQHHDSLGNSQEAIHVLQEAIDHTPTDVQLYMLLARVYKVCYRRFLLPLVVF